MDFAHVRESGFWNQGNFCPWNLESGKILLAEFKILGFGIRNTAQGIWNSGSTNMQNLSSTNKDQDPVPGIRRPWHGIQSPRLSWIFLHGVNGSFVREELDEERERNISNHKIQSQKLTSWRLENSVKLLFFVKRHLISQDNKTMMPLVCDIQTAQDLFYFVLLFCVLNIVVYFNL